MTNEPISVLICDDQAIVRDGLGAILGADPGLVVVETASDGEEAIEAASRLGPDVVLMDLNMPGIGGVEATRQISANGTRVLVLTTYDDETMVMGALRAGAYGYLLKDAPRREITDAIKQVALGLRPLDPAIGETIVNAALADNSIRDPAASEMSEHLAADFRLTDRETDILKLIAQGQSNPAIGKQLHLSTGTVRNHVSSILAKLAANDRAHAAAIAVKHNLT